MMKVVSYNIHQCVGTDSVTGIDRILRIIETLDADLVGLQEVQRNNTNGCDLLQRIENQRIYHCISGPTLATEIGHYGNALLSKREITEYRTLDISCVAREPRGAIDARLSVAGNRIQCITTHLGLRRWERRAQVRKIADALDYRTCGYQLVMGDFNEWHPFANTLWPLRGLMSWRGSMPTFPTRLPLFALDRIGAGPGRCVSNVSVVRTPFTTVASDHFPLLAEIDWPRQDAW